MQKVFNKIGWKTSAAIVISSMIGTGVFTTLGFQLVDTQNTFAIVLLWIFGGILAIFGAFCYAELGVFFKENGGDYIYLSKTYHPLFGYISSWSSLIIGFSAPVSLASLAMAKYLGIVHPQWTVVFAIGIIVLVALFQSFSIEASSKFHNFFTLLKISFILLLIILGVVIPSEGNYLITDSSWKKEMLSPAFATSLVFVTYAYTGWNAASYIAGEIENPKKNLPKALVVGTIFVTLVYVVINFIMLKYAPIQEMKGKEEVMAVASQYMLGDFWSNFINAFIALQLIATISGYLWVGSRITQATAEGNKLWSILATKNKSVPVKAIWAHVFIAIIIILTGSFKEIFIYTAFVLQLLATLAISTVYFIKPSQRHIFKNNFFYIFPTVFILFSLYILYFTMLNNPKESIIGLLILLVGAVLYFIDKRFSTYKSSDS